ncbi:MAG: hypothetical protein ABI200_07030 [Gaiellales bacterium]
MPHKHAPTPAGAPPLAEPNGVWISQGGTPHGSLKAKWLGMRNVVKWGASQLVNPMRTMWVATTYKAEGDARKFENALFHDSQIHYGKKIRIGYDNGPDAFRHTYASALIVYRLMRDRGADATQAVEFLHGAGNAHERDSWAHTFSQDHGRYASEMDINNNLLGHRLGSTLAAEHAASGVDMLTGEAQLRHDVLEAIGSGVRLDGDTTGLMLDEQGKARATVMDHFESAPRAAAWGDIAQLAPDGTPLRSADGELQLRTHVPDAPGFPTPIRDGVVDLTLPHARLGPEELSMPRDDTPQA